MKKFITVIGGLFLTVVAGLLVNWLTPVNIPALICRILSGTWAFLCKHVSLPLWMLIGVAFVCPFLLWSFRHLLATSKDENQLPPEKFFFRYTSDSFLGIDWNWAYSGNRINDDSITARCPKCKFLLDWIQESAYRIIDNITLICPNCQFRKEFDINKEDVVHLIHQHIDQKIVTGEFKKNV